METDSMITKLTINLRDGIVQVEGDEKFVRDVYNDFKERVSQPVLLQPPMPAKELEFHASEVPSASDGAVRRKSKTAKAANPEGGKTKAGAYKPTFNSKLNLTGLTEFYDKFDPKNTSEKILTFAIFLRDRIKITPCSADDIYTCFFTLKDRTKIPTAFVAAFYNTQTRTHFIEFTPPQQVHVTIAGDNHFSQKAKKKEPVE